MHEKQPTIQIKAKTNKKLDSVVFPWISSGLQWKKNVFCQTKQKKTWANGVEWVQQNATKKQNAVPKKQHVVRKIISFSSFCPQRPCGHRLFWPAPSRPASRQSPPAHSCRSSRPPSYSASVVETKLQHKIQKENDLQIQTKWFKGSQ